MFGRRLPGPIVEYQLYYKIFSSSEQGTRVTRNAPCAKVLEKYLLIIDTTIGRKYVYIFFQADLYSNIFIRVFLNDVWRRSVLM